MINWRCERGESRVRAWKGKCPRPWLVVPEITGPQGHRPMEDSCFGGDLVIHTSGSSTGAAGAMGLSQPCHTPLQHIRKNSKGSGDLTGTKALGLSQLCDVRQVISHSEPQGISSPRGEGQIEGLKDSPRNKILRLHTEEGTSTREMGVGRLASPSPGRVLKTECPCLPIAQFLSFLYY